MGHEVSGIVAEVGQGVTDEWLGARVVSETYFSTCGVCEWCRDGRTNLCPERRSIGSFVDGAFAATVVVPARNLHRVPRRGRRARSRAVRAARVCLPMPLRPCQRSPPATTCSSRGRGRWGCSPPRSRARSAARVLVTGLARDEVRLDGGAGARVRDGDGGRAGRGRTLPRRDRVLRERGRRVGLSRGRAPRRPLRPGRRLRPPRHRPPRRACSRRSSSSPRATRRRRARGGGRCRSWRTRRVQLEPLVSEVVPLDAWERVFADLREGKAVKYVFDPRL